MHIKTFKGGYDSNFTYIVEDDNECIVLDPAVPAKEVLEYIKEKKFKPVAVVFMHSHFDHRVELDVYREEGIPVMGHESTEIKTDKLLEDGEMIKVGNVELKVIHTPGHRYDCICLLTGNHLFTSDTLFVEGCGAVHFPGSDPGKMVKTLDLLKSLPDDVVIYPGHDYGSTQTSTIGREKKNNRFLNMGREEFVRDRLR